MKSKTERSSRSPSSLAGRLTVLYLTIIGLAGLQIATAEAAETEIAIENLLPLWSELPREHLTDLRLTDSPTARAFSLNHAGLEALLRAQGRSSTVELDIPRPRDSDGADGSSVRIRLEPTPTMAPELARRYPDVRTFAGRGLGPDTLVTARATWSPLGFRAWVRDGAGSFFVEPVDSKAGAYVSYRPESLLEADAPVDCAAGEPVAGTPYPGPEESPRAIAAKAAGPDIDVFRLAVAATSEFTQNVANGSSTIAFLTIIAAVNQVNGILEAEAGVRLQLVPETTQLIYVDPDDPYTDVNREALALENQANLEKTIGLDAFDIGHVFAWDAVGGIAVQSSVCFDEAKGRGATSWEPNSLRWLQIFAHEISHQLGASHTFNSTSGLCVQRSFRTAWEAGSGNSLMSYGGGGRCYPESVPGDRLSRLHSGSLEEIRKRVDFATSFFGCGSKSPLANAEPAVIALGLRPIPALTPFRLQALAVDPDDDDLTFCWEQRNLGAASPPHQDDGYRPLFALECGGADDRAGTLQYDSRTFPARDSLLRGALEDIGQTLPATDRELRIGVSVRDDEGGFAEAQTVVSVNDQAGPFRVTSPNGFAIWDSSPRIVRWDVAGTTAPPVSCSKVDVLLSTDGGLTFPTTLLTQTANDGIAWVTVPSLWATRARIEIRCSDHVFFDVSDTNFWIRTRSF